MEFPEQESQATAQRAPCTNEATRFSTALRAQREGEPIWTPEYHVAPPVAILQLVTGRWVSQIVGVAAELGLADEIQTGPKGAEELAAAKGLHATTLYRLLRALASFGIFAEQDDGRFRQTPMSDVLRSDVAYSMRSIARVSNHYWMMHGWMGLEQSVRTGTSAFEHVHGLPSFEYVSRRPEVMEIFADALAGFAVLVGSAVVEAYHFSSTGTLAEIGGSHGVVLAMVLAKYRQLRGILFDMPSFVEWASNFFRNQGVEHRVEVKSGNFLEDAPEGADAYFLQNSLHRRSDDECMRILNAVRAAAKPGAKLVVVEAIVETTNEPQFAKTWDITMLVATRGGRERTRAEWLNLLGAAGFRVARIIPTASFASVIEAIRG